MFGWLGLLIGAILLVLGGYMIFFFPGALDYQTKEMATVGVVLGFIFAILGAILIFIG
ncbi:MAG: hypothetical protein ABIF08_02365 [Nanoarchaeota archaeon]